MYVRYTTLQGRSVCVTVLQRGGMQTQLLMTMEAYAMNYEQKQLHSLGREQQQPITRRNRINQRMQQRSPVSSPGRA